LIKECDNNIDTAVNKQKQANLELEKTKKNINEAKKYLDLYKSESSNF